MIRKVVTLTGLAVALSIAISCGSLSVVRIQGNAMLPTYKDGDRVVIKKDLDHIDRLDVLIFRYPDDTTKTYIKRVIGLPGETVSIENGKVTIDGKELAEPYVDQFHNQSNNVQTHFKVPAESYFVLGDNRDNSSDSRYWGAVKKELIIGKCSLVY